MQRIKIVPLFVVCLLAVLNTAAGNFTVTGLLKGADKQWIYFSWLPDEGNAVITDSSFIQKGQFTFSGSIQTPTFGLLYTDSPHIQGYFMFDKGPTKITGDMAHENSLTVTGSEATALFHQYKLVADSFNNYRRSLQNLIATVRDSILHTQYMNNYYISMSEEEAFAEEFINQHHNSYVCAYILYYKFSGEDNINKGLAILSTLDTAVRQSKYAKLLLQRAESLKQQSTGKPAANFSFPDSSGKQVILSDFKNKYVLVDFWASWCAPCRRENPGLLKAYRRFRNKGFEIISISFDENRRQWISAIRKDSLEWVNVCDLKGWDNNEAAQLYGVQSLPANFLVDKNGIIVAKNLMGTGLEYELEKVFEKK